MELGELINALELVSPKLLVAILKRPCFADPTSLHSYRGYYTDLAIGGRQEPTTVEEFQKALQKAVGKTYLGYKGGQFRMTKTTPLWFSAYGDVSNLYFQALDPCPSINRLYLITAKETF
jgi:hypothetical protein